MLLTALLLLAFPQIYAEFDPFSDSIPFSIKWKGPLDPAVESQLDDDVITLPMVTKDNEKYECRFHNDEDNGNEPKVAETYSGPSARALLKEFAIRTSCSYRVESYWTYELCHGKHIRQFHEERDVEDQGESIISLDYYLGNIKEDQTEEEEEKVPTILLEGRKYPYLMVEYDKGTLCDLTGGTRRTTVQYICYEGGRGDVYQIKETSTCEYNAIVLLGDLCKHPDYSVIKESSRIISCHSVDGAPTKPKMQEEVDKALLKRPAKVETVRPIKGIGSTTKTKQEATRTDVGASEDIQFLRNFLSGEQCLQGGTGAGWWSYELCYGKTAKQFHSENGKRVVNVLLGKWDLNEHLQWLEKHPNRKPRSKPNRKYISQFYSGGDICDATNTHRAVEVRLKCSQSASSSSHAVAIYLLEPEVCQYTLTVESPIFCDLIQRADDRGLIP